MIETIRAPYIKFELLGSKPFLSVAGLKPFIWDLTKGSKNIKIMTYRQLITTYDQASVYKAILTSKIMTLAQLNQLAAENMKVLPDGYPKVNYSASLTAAMIKTYRTGRTEDKILGLRSLIKKHGIDNVRAWFGANNVIPEKDFNLLLSQVENEQPKNWTLPELYKGAVTNSTEIVVDKSIEVAKKVKEEGEELLFDWKTWALVGGAGLLVLIILLRR